VPEPLTLLEEAERVLTRAQKRPEGLLRITVPVILSQEPFFNFMSAFMKDHARIRVELVVTNLLLDLIAGKYRRRDPRRRAARFQTSSPGGSAQAFITLVAAPEYLNARTLPAEPADLNRTTV